MSEWISVEDRLPEETDALCEEYLVCVNRSHYPRSSYDIVDSPYDETFVTTALYYSEQKIWNIIGIDEWLNALFTIEDSPLNGDFVTHWMPLPEPPKEENT